MLRLNFTNCKGMSKRMLLLSFVFLHLCVFSNVQSSKQVTLTCGTDLEEDVVIAVPGHPGKRWASGTKGDMGEKGEKGEIGDSYEAIPELERKVLSFESQLTAFHRGQREAQRSQRRNKNQILQLRQQTSQLEEQLRESEVKIAEIKNNVSSIQNATTNQVHGRTIDSANRDCQDLLASGITKNGIYRVLVGESLEYIYCDMESDGEGWTVFQKRQLNRYLNFEEKWDVYKRGFGNLGGDFWLGLDIIEKITRDRSCKLRVDVWDTISNNHQFATYRKFSIADESDNYRLRVSGYNGTAGDGLTESSKDGGIHHNMQFSTRDRDNDITGRQNCGASFLGGWWFNACYESCLNCRERNFYWKTDQLQSSTMKFRCN